MNKNFRYILALLLICALSVGLVGCAAVYTVTVEYVDIKSGEPLREPFVLTVKEGKSYSVKEQIGVPIEGYLFVTTIGNSGGLSINGNLTVSCRYKVNHATRTYMITVNYVDAVSGKPLGIAPYTVAARGGANYDVTEQANSAGGYYAAEIIGEVEGYLEGDVAITSRMLLDLSALSYDEYFAEPREFVPTNYTVVYNEDGEVDYAERDEDNMTVAGGRILVDRGGADFVFDEPGGLVIDAGATSIYLVRSDGSEELLMRADNLLSHWDYPPDVGMAPETHIRFLYDTPLLCNRELMFFVSFDRVIRYHIPSRTADILFEAKNDLRTVPRIDCIIPLSSQEVFIMVWTEYQLYRAWGDMFRSSTDLFRDPNEENPMYDLYVYNSAESKLYKIGDGNSSFIKDIIAQYPHRTGTAQALPDFVFYDKLVLAGVLEAYAAARAAVQ